jgi:hypothetical protein
MRTGCFFQAHGSTGSVSSWTSNRMVTRGGKFVGGGMVHACHGGDGRAHRIIPLRIAGAFLPGRIADLPVAAHRDLHLGGVIVVGHVFRPVPFRAEGVFERALVNIHRIGTADDGLAAFKFKRRQFGGGRRDDRRGDRGGALAVFDRLGRFNRFGCFDDLRRFFLGLSGSFGFSGGFSFTSSTERFCNCLPSQPCARQNKAPPARARRERRMK